MNSINSKILKPLILLFVIGLVASLYFLYEFPTALESSSPLITPDAINEASSVILKLSAILIITLLLGLTYIVISAQNKTEKEVVEKIVYIDKTKQENSGNQDEEALTKIDKIKIDEIITAVKNKKSLQTKYDAIINELCKKLEASQGIFYTVTKSGNKKSIGIASTFAHSMPESTELKYEFGEGLVGQAAKEAKAMRINEIPEDYMPIVSGLGNALPKYLLIQPIIIDQHVEALVELASFREFTGHDESVISEVIKFVSTEVLQIENESSVVNEANKVAKKK